MQVVCPACGDQSRISAARAGADPSCRRCGEALLPAAPVDMDDQRLEHYLRHTDMPVLIDFWAPWCAPCGQMAPHLVQAAAGMPAVRFVKVNTDTAPVSAIRWAIRGIPNLILTRRGRELARVKGSMSAAQLADWVEHELRLEREAGMPFGGAG